jgi:hypothetical protein
MRRQRVDRRFIDGFDGNNLHVPPMRENGPNLRFQRKKDVVYALFLHWYCHVRKRHFALARNASTGRS